MLRKHLVLCSTRRSYSVGRVLVQYIKTSDTYKKNFQRYFQIHTNFSRKSLAHDLPVKNALNESFEHYIEEKDRNSKHRRHKVADEIFDYLHEFCPEGLINEIPKKCFKRNRLGADQIYLVNPIIADTIVQCLQDSIVKERTVVLEANPGLGILSKKLIDAGVQRLHLHEPSPVFHKTLMELFLQHDRVTLHTTDFLSLGKLAYQDKKDQGTRVQDILSHYPKKDWVEEPSLKIIGYMQSSEFIKHLITSLVFQSGIMMHSRPELLVFLPPTLHLSLTCSGKDGYLRYRSVSVLFQIFFDFEILDKIPRKAFLPWAMPPSRKKRKVEEVATLDEEWLYLMRIVPKRDLYETISPEKLPAIWHFVRHHFWSRSGKLIQEMESWIPGCGVHLVLEGYNIFTEFGDLKPNEVLHIFQLFSSWPEYQDSSFLSSMESSLLKLEENNPDETIDQLENLPKEGDQVEDFNDLDVK